MRHKNQGFSLIELMLALAITLLLVLGVGQVFIAAKNTHLSQRAAAGMQEDARFVLSKMIQDIRMVACLVVWRRLLMSVRSVILLTTAGRPSVGIRLRAVCLW